MDSTPPNFCFLPLKNDGLFSIIDVPGIWQRPILLPLEVYKDKMPLMGKEVLTRCIEEVVSGYL